MRIAFLYGGFSLGNRPLDFDALYEAPRGLTGSELSCVEYARAMRARGHDVLLLVGQEMAPREWHGLRVRSLDDPKLVSDCDVVYAWNEPNLLREVAPGPLRAVNQQLNDFAYCHQGWESWCDLVTSPSAHHLAFLRRHAPGVRTWKVVPNGCDPTQYSSAGRIPGRVIWASSADRGLHLLLEAWPAIKRRVPHASLRCFYHFADAHFDALESTGPNVHPDLLEIAQRKRYIRYAMHKLAGTTWGVEHVGSVSRVRMAAELGAAEVLAYPANTIRYTEGFSVTTLEACASGCVPVITDADALGQIYAGAAQMIALGQPPRFGTQQRAELVDLVVRGLVDGAWRGGQAALCQLFAERYVWPTLAEQLEQTFTSALADMRHKEKRPTQPMAEVIAQ